MSMTRGTTLLHQRGIEHALLRYEHAVKGAAYAAEALAIEPARLAKSLVALVDDEPVFALVPADRELSPRLLARALGGRSAQLAEPAAAQRLTGYQIGGISPFGSRRTLRVAAERAWLEHERVALNAGRRGLIVELAASDLRALLDPVVADLSLPKE